MRRKQSYLLWSAAGAVLGMGAVSAMAQTVQLSIVATPANGGVGTWSAYATADSGTDNIGLATFALDVIGSGGATVTGSYNDAPTGSVTSGSFKGDPSGFSEFPSNGQGGSANHGSASSPGTPGNGIAITAGQNITYGSTHSAPNDLEMVQGFGKSAQSTATQGVTWAFPALLADGTYSVTGANGLLTVSADLSVGAGVQTLNEVSAGKWVGPGNISTDTTFAGTVHISNGVTATTAFNLEASAPVGTSLGPELVETGSEPYNLLTLTESSPVVTGNFQFTGFHQGDAIDVLLKLGSTAGGDPAPGDLANIIAYINGNDGTEGTIASAVPAGLAALYPGYDLLLTTTAPAGDPYADFDFSGFGDTSIPTGSLGISAVGLVPEPASLSLLALGGIGLISRRRAKKASK
jgi:hypothetical protein